MRFLLKTTQVLISAIIVAASRTTRTAVTASKRVASTLLPAVTVGKLSVHLQPGYPLL